MMPTLLTTTGMSPWFLVPFGKKSEAELAEEEARKAFDMIEPDDMLVRLRSQGLGASQVGEHCFLISMQHRIYAGSTDLSATFDASSIQGFQPQFHQSKLMCGELYSMPPRESMRLQPFTLSLQIYGCADLAAQAMANRVAAACAVEVGLKSKVLHPSLGRGRFSASVELVS